MKITKEIFWRLMSYDLQGKFCIEIDFQVEGRTEYQNCCMGKMPSLEDQSKDCFWYGLTPDGTQAYDYATLQEMCDAPVFRGHSLLDVWDQVEFCSLNGSPFEERIDAYL